MATGKLTARSGPPLQEDSYIYQIVPIRSYLAAISSDNLLRLVDPTTLQETPNGLIPNVHAGVTNLRVPKRNSDTLITAGRDAVVKSWDVRSSAQTITFEDGSNAPYLSLGCNDVLVAAGSELTNHQATVSIWQAKFTKSLQSKADIRRRDYRNPSKPFRQYVESHSDDVTELAFHPSKSNVLLSGSTDSLINIYDTDVAEEDDALLQILNHGSSIHHAAFLSINTVYGLSHDEMFSLYHFDHIQQDDEEEETSRDTAFGNLRDTLNCEYVVDVIVSGHGDGGSAIVAAGSCSNQYLDLVPLDYTLEASARFDKANKIRLEGAHGTEVVRSFCFADELQNTVFTAGEDGRIRAWRVDSPPGRAKEEPRRGAADNDDNREDGQSDVGKGKRKNARFKPY